MNVNQKNELLARGEVDREGMWPRIAEYESKAAPYLFEFGLKDLPTEPGLITVRGPRQYGKSTWLDLELRYSIEDFGAGCAFYINGDELNSAEELYDIIIKLCASFSKNASVRRLFIDEISAVDGWERAVKRAYDEGATRNVLIITTGSKSTDLLRGSERLPGRKGTLSRSEYLFLPISYNQFKLNTHREIKGDSAWISYLLSGGAPLAANDIYQFERIPEYFIDLIRDWILGEIVRSGRSRYALQQVLAAIYRRGGTPVGYAKLSRESGLANNTVASGFVEQLSDLLSIVPQWQRDVEKDVFIFRKPAKFPFINLAAAIAFHPGTLRYVHEFQALSAASRAVLVEWLVAQELVRRASYNGERDPTKLGFWASKEHEIDFVAPDGELYEVKLGQASSIEFAWFKKTFPKRHLTVICATPFETDSVRGLTLEQFLIEGPSRMVHRFDLDKDEAEEI